MKQNKSRYAILGALTWGPQSGYDIRKNIEGSVGNFWSESYGQIYPLLKELVADGLATKTVEVQEGKPNRNVYTLTEQGRDELTCYLQEPAESQTGRVEILLKLFFGRQVSAEINMQQVQHFQAFQREMLQRYAQIEQTLQTNEKNHPDLPYWLVTLRYGKHVCEALLTWSEETLTQLAAMTGE